MSGRGISAMLNKPDIDLKALEATIEKHLPDTGYDWNNIVEAKAIKLAFQFSEKRYQAWKRKDETEKLENIERGLRDVIKEIEGLHPYLKMVFLFGAASDGGHPEGIRVALREIERSAKVGIETAKEDAARGKGGRSNFDMISVYIECRHIWNRRKGLPPRKSDHADAPGPFGKFVEAVFEDLGIHGTAATAARAARNLAESRKQPDN